MNIKPLDKTYEILSCKELASLAFMYATDKLEFSKINTQVPNKTYLMKDLAFTNTLDRLNIMTSAWVADYWRLHFNWASALVALLMTQKDLDEENIKEKIKIVDFYTSNIAGHIEAYIEVCKTHGIDSEVIFKRFNILRIQHWKSDKKDKEWLINELENLIEPKY